MDFRRKLFLNATHGAEARDVSDLEGYSAATHIYRILSTR